MRPKLLVIGLFLIVFCGAGGWVVNDTLQEARHSGKNVVCLDNLKHLCLGMLTYAEDHDGKWPPRDSWMDAIEPTLPNKWAEHCTEISAPVLYGYSFNSTTRAAGDIADPAHKPFIYDSVNLARNASDPFNSLPQPGRHEGRNEIVFADGHARPNPPFK